MQQGMTMTDSTSRPTVPPSARAQSTAMRARDFRTLAGAGVVLLIILAVIFLGPSMIFVIGPPTATG